MSGDAKLCTLFRSSITFLVQKLNFPFHETEIYVVCRLGGPYSEKLGSTGFHYTDRP